MDALAEPDRPQEEGRAVLSVHLRALRFLLLLEEDGAALLPLQPPFFTSQTAQQAAATLYEAQRAMSSAFLSRQLGDCLLAALRKEMTEPSTPLGGHRQLRKVFRWPPVPPGGRGSAEPGAGQERLPRGAALIPGLGAVPQVLAESCQFIVSSLGEYVKRSKQQPFGREDVLSLCAFTEGHCRVLHQLLERVRQGLGVGRPRSVVDQSLSEQLEGS